MIVFFGGTKISINKLTSCAWTLGCADVGEGHHRAERSAKAQDTTRSRKAQDTTRSRKAQDTTRTLAAAYLLNLNDRT